MSEFLIQQVSMMASAENILETCLTLLSLISAEGLLASHDDVSRESEWPSQVKPVYSMS